MILDGNAVAGELQQVFGMEMTMGKSVCAACGASSYVGEMVVYMRGPGTVARCRACNAIHLVLVTVRDVTCVDMSGLKALEVS